MRLTLGLAICALASALAGCGDEARLSVATDTYLGTPGGIVPGDTSLEATSAVWIVEGKTFGVITYGSSTPTCRPVPTRVTGTRDTVTVHFEEGPEEVCNGDLQPSTHEFRLPQATIAPSVTIRLTGIESPSEIVLPTLD